MSRSNPKGKGKGSAHPRPHQFEDFEDERPNPRGYHIDDMEVEFDDDRREERRVDRGDDRRGARRGDPREDDWEDRREVRRDDNRGTGRYDPQDDRREVVGEGWITQFFPTTGIEWEVIAGDIQIYLGPEASVRMAPDPDDSRRMAYWVRAKNNTLTAHMMSDLMADSIAWKNEKSRDRNNQSYFDTQTHRERQKIGPSRRLPVVPSALSRHDRYRSDGPQPLSTSFSGADRSALGASPPVAGDNFAQSMSENRTATLASQRDQSLLTRVEAEQIIARRLRDKGRTGITRIQLENLIDDALGQASATQEQFLTREQAQAIIVQRLKAAGKTSVTKVQLEGLINQKIQESKQENFERVVDEAIQKGQERPVANQARPAAQAAPPSQPQPRNPDPDGSFGHPKNPDYSRHKKTS